MHFDSKWFRPTLQNQMRPLNDALNPIQALKARATQGEADHADLQTLKEQLAHLLGEAVPANAQARK